MFRVHQKVECVDADGAPQITKGCVYTVLRVLPSELMLWRGRIRPSQSLLLVEVAPNIGDAGFSPDRFRPIVERKTDISIFEEILRRESVPDECAPAAVYGVDWGASA